ncbi:branched-chain amino acid ABC transporter permease [Castellaniella sp. GW247-6E4]|uniref:branched-chain amino acid ABC transporter permease n=1 Tax=Castellaniella sp. GW247-6E4 TaxID=3140380 RepID=UPI003315B4CA
MDVATLIGQSIVNGLVLGTMYFLMAIGFTMVFGIMRVVNFAHGEFYMLGGFAVLYLFGSLHWYFLAALVGAALLVGVLGFAMERIIFRPFRGDELSGMIAALGLSIVLQNTAALVFGAMPQSMPDVITGSVALGPVIIPFSRLMVIVLSFAILALLWLFIRFSRTGRAMRAMVQDSTAATLQGMRPQRIYPIAFGMGAGLAALAGGIMAPVLTVEPFMGAIPLLKAFVVVILGGLGSVMGAVLAGLGLGIFESFVSNFYGAAAADLLQFLLVITILLVRPQGLLGEKEV